MDRKDSVVLPKEAVRCAIYARTASSSQPENNAAIAQQIARCREAAHKNGWAVAEDCVRTDVGKSGNTKEGRAGVQDLIALAATKPHPFDYLICDSTDRLARNLSIAGQILDALTKKGVSVHFASLGLGTADPYFREHFIHGMQGDWAVSLSRGAKIRRGILRSRIEKAKNAAAPAITTPACDHACADCSHCHK
jgi:DNA invertase Pin-like site-specific DNA recombinase